MSGKEENFTVRRANSLDDLRWIVNNLDKDGWRPREKDGEYLFAINFTRFIFLGELSGERVSCIAIIKYSEDLTYVGWYLVIEPHRGKGYGYRTWKYAFEASSIGEQCNVVLYAVSNMEQAYRKIGFKRVWVARRYRVTTSNVAKALSATTPPEEIKILPGSGVDINKLAEYDRSIYGVSRQLSVASWICFGDVSFVAFNEKTDIVGYIILRKTINFEEDGYCVLPLFADNVSIALFLVRKVIEVIKRADQSIVLTFDVPLEGNPEGLEFLKISCEGETIYEQAFMSTKGVCHMPRNKVFAVASNEV